MSEDKMVFQELWKCPDLTCSYRGTPSIHILNLPPNHTWSAAQVADTLNPKKKYPFNWEGHEGH